MHGICYSNVLQSYSKSMVTPRLPHLYPTVTPPLTHGYPTSRVTRWYGICNPAVGLSIAGLQLFGICNPEAI
jgi:hypothetical protein